MELKKSILPRQKDVPYTFIFSLDGLGDAFLTLELRPLHVRGAGGPTDQWR